MDLKKGGRGTRRDTRSKRLYDAALDAHADLQFYLEAKGRWNDGRKEIGVEKLKLERLDDSQILERQCGEGRVEEEVLVDTSHSFEDAPR